LITRVKIDGFKNLENVELFLGPFICIAGRNGVGKSNLFDALLFLKESVDKPLLEAASMIRGADPLVNLFTFGRRTMALEIDFLVERQGYDDFGRQAHASATFLTYQLSIGYVEASAPAHRDNLEVLSENLTYVRRSQANKKLAFDHSSEWSDSVWAGTRRSPYISTDKEKGVIRLHQDRTNESKRGGRPWEFPLQRLPRTALSSVTNAQESPTLILAQKALKSTTLLQLEPTALRAPASFQDPTSISSEGRHLPATLNRIAKTEDPESAYAQISNRLAEIVDDVDAVRVDRDPERRLFTLFLKDREGREFQAGSLSDGTLRFLALAVLELDPRRGGVLCLEEPENGIHPEKLGAMITLLEDIAVDPEEPVDETNPLQQVLINTHSPLIVSLVNQQAILFAKKTPSGLTFKPVQVSQAPKKQSTPTPISLGEVLNYLNPLERDLELRENRKGSLYRQLELEF